MAQLPGENAIRADVPQPALRPIRAQAAPTAPAGTGMEIVGKAMENLGDDIFKAQQQADHVRVEDAFNQLRQKQIELTFGDQGYTNLRGGNAVNRPLLKDYGQAFDKSAADIANTLGNDNQKRAFALRAAGARLQLSEGIMRHVEQESTEYAKSTLDGTVTSETQLAEANWNRPEMLLSSVARLNNAIDAYAQRPDTRMSPEEVQAAKDRAQASIFHAAVRQALSQSPDLGRQAFNLYSDKLKGEQRATLENQIRTREVQEMNASLIQDQRIAAMAERDLHNSQTAEYSRLYAATLKPTKDNPAPTANQLADLVQKQVITPAMSDHLISLRKRGPAEDKVDAVVALHTLINDPSVSVKEKTDAIARAGKGGSITASTAGTLIDSVYNKDTRGESAAARSAKAVVLASAGVPEGMINFGNDDKVKRAAVLNEWDRRVTNGGEDPIKVRDEMVLKYQPSGTPPLTWDQPKYGAILNSGDVVAVKAKTQAAIEQGILTGAEADEQKRLIVQYANFFDQQRRAAEAAALARGKTDRSKGGGAVVRQQPAAAPVMATPVPGG